LADAAHVFFGNPSHALTVVGVTGTKGKTTTSSLIRSLLTAAGKLSGLLGTVSYETGKRTVDAPNTTPSALTVARLLDEMRRNRLKAVSMEVSSHALEMERVKNVEFDGVVFTNLSREHLDFHHTFPKYYAAKRRLFFEFPTVKVRAVNADDAWGRKLLKELGRKGVGFGLKQRCAYCADQVVIEPRRIAFRVQGKQFEAPLSGRFNVYNALAAISVLRELGLPWNALQKSLSVTLPPPGRFERVEEGQPFTVLVDYAHSPGALKEALREARHLAGKKGRVLSLFGCGGDRDRTKRPVMGHLSATLADLTYVTSDNPRSEDPRAILKEVLSGVPSQERASVHVEVDRSEAIRQVLQVAEADDVVLIAGKGHETYQIVGGKKAHFDDREVARKVLKSL
jgi:UDP-N-acetylmuramoyl-L-alanyl-D-glutamate--2,6-diaminopimelate ligase